MAPEDAFAVFRAEVSACSLACARGTLLCLLSLARLECQMALGADALDPAAMKGLGPWPLPAAICSMERPEAMDLSCSVPSISVLESTLSTGPRVMSSPARKVDPAFTCSM